jgi:hypothetical protein
MLYIGRLPEFGEMPTFGPHRSHQKRCPFVLALSALFLGFSKTYSGTIAVDLNLIFGVEN